MHLLPAIERAKQSFEPQRGQKLNNGMEDGEKKNRNGLGARLFALSHLEHRSMHQHDTYISTDTRSSTSTSTNICPVAKLASDVPSLNKGRNMNIYNSIP
jgi:hypothetical protein